LNGFLFEVLFAQKPGAGETVGFAHPVQYLLHRVFSIKRTLITKHFQAFETIMPRVRVFFFGHLVKSLSFQPLNIEKHALG